MNIIGIVAEYNPFHNGHIYQIKKIKELYKNSIIVVVMSSNFTERGIPAIMNKWDRTNICLNYGVDLVIELPFAFSTQSSDIFAHGAIKILKELKVDTIVFGSELNDINYLKSLANIQINDSTYQEKVKEYLDKGYNYPTSMSKALNKETILNSNDLLGLSYIKEILLQDANINPITIKRTNSYLDKELDNNISSATSIREAIINNKDFSNSVPKETLDVLKNNSIFLNDYFDLLKYKINSSLNLRDYLDVDEGLDNRIKKFINKVNNIDELRDKLKTKRYTYNKLNRMFIHILCSYKKEDNINLEINYIRVLGFTTKGQKYLNSIKKNLNVPLLTKYEKILESELKITSIYALGFSKEKQNKIIESEYKNKVIIKKSIY